MKRYEFWTSEDGCGCQASADMRPDDDGDWVTFDDHAQEMARNAAEVARLIRERDEANRMRHLASSSREKWREEWYRERAIVYTLRADLQLAYRRMSKMDPIVREVSSWDPDGPFMTPSLIESVKRLEEPDDE
jgi:KaiC/GvpD/RAD55 family RecA-like ATPase